MKNPNPEAYKDPETPINVSKTVKKSAIGWAVPAILILICLGFVALAKSEARDMMKDYMPKDEADRIHAGYERRLNECYAQIESLKDKLDSMDKKLDRVQYILEFNQGRPLLSPKQKDQP